MKLIINFRIIILIVSLSSCTQAQTVNILSVNDFYNAKFNGVTLNSIENTKGNVSPMQTLFNNSLLHSTYTEPNLGISFWDNSKSIYISFEDGTDTGSDYTLTNASIDSNLSYFTILGKNITIGDNITKLGNVLINTDSKGMKNIMFGTGTSDDGIFINFINKNLLRKIGALKNRFNII